jgi:pilus assembly protein Flp/PilA
MLDVDKFPFPVFVAARQLCDRRAVIMSILQRTYRFLRDEDGPAAVEYAVLLALILMAIISAIGGLGVETGGMWNNIRGELQNCGFIR